MLSKTTRHLFTPLAGLAVLSGCSKEPISERSPEATVGSVELQSGGATTGDTIRLNDAPGNWFKSNTSGTSLSVVNAGNKVDFSINNCCTTTRHTATLLVKPDGSGTALDQGDGQSGTLSATLDTAGVYVFVCKIHPYMTSVVAAKTSAGAIPDVTSTSLPFIGHLGVSSLPAGTVLSVLRTLAATDSEKTSKWQIYGANDPGLFVPSTPGVGEVWINTQFERVPSQTNNGVEKPGTITVVDAATFTVEREVNGLGANGLWNNPHNMWANDKLSVIYNSNWFGQWVNKIDRVNGTILGSVNVGHAPTHIITNPDPNSPYYGELNIPLSAEKEMVKVRDDINGFRVVDKRVTGSGNTHPHAHWMTCGTGGTTVVPNVFKDVGFAGSVSFMNSNTGAVLSEISYDASHPLKSALLMPLAAGECHVDINGQHVHKAYVGSVVSGKVSVFDVASRTLTSNIDVTLTPDGQFGQNILHTLQVPIQVPVSPDGRWAAAAILSLTTVTRAQTGSADHVALIDTTTDTVVKLVGTSAGTHGVNWGAKAGGGYYAWITSQFSNVVEILDPDPNNDGNGADAAIVGRIRLANGSTGAGVSDGTGGQGVKPLPMVHDGWIQRTANLVGTGQLTPEVEGWINALTTAQKNPN